MERRTTEKFIYLGWFSQPHEIGLANPEPAETLMNPHHLLIGRVDLVLSRQRIEEEATHLCLHSKVELLSLSLS
jgi:hypothetical protein